MYQCVVGLGQQLSIAICASVCVTDGVGLLSVPVCVGTTNPLSTNLSLSRSLSYCMTGASDWVLMKKHKTLFPRGHCSQLPIHAAMQALRGQRVIRSLGSSEDGRPSVTCSAEPHMSEAAGSGWRQC